jgi:hypothetical protein
MTTEQRLDRLERENKWIRRIGAVCLAVAAAVFLIGQGKDKGLPDLVGRSLTLRTAAGFVWLEAKPEKGGGLLQLKTEKPPFEGIWLQTGAEQKAIVIMSDRFEQQVLLGTRDGSPQIGLATEGGRRIAMIGEHPDGHGAFAAFDKDEKIAWKAPPGTRWPIKDAERPRED